MFDSRVANAAVVGSLGETGHGIIRWDCSSSNQKRWDCSDLLLPLFFGSQNVLVYHFVSSFNSSIGSSTIASSMGSTVGQSVV